MTVRMTRKTLLQAWVPIDVFEFYERLAQQQNNSLSGVAGKVLADHKTKEEAKAKRAHAKKSQEVRKAA